MKKFIGRSSELRILEKEYRRDAGFTVIYGRRRVGKTTLIKEFIKDKDAMYFLATEELEGENIKNFVSAFSRFSGTGYLENARFTDWESVFRIFAQHSPEKKKVLVIDEFQYLTGANPAFSSVLQRIWDTFLSESNVMLIVCGSLISMMLKEVLSYDSPLYGRRTAQIKLSPLSFSEFCLNYEDMSFEDLVKFYSVTGGVPKYMELLDESLDIMENIKSDILQRGSFLYEEPVFLLEKEVKNTMTYFSVIKTRAAGNHRISDIASVLEVKSSFLTPYLGVLIDLEILEKRTPATERFPEKSRKGQYYIKDNFISFWFRFVAPYKGELEIENLDPVVKKIEANMNDSHVSFVFEDVSRQNLRNAGLPYIFNRIGSYWEKNVEVDVCAIDESEGICVLGECKYWGRPVDMRVYSQLVEEGRGIKEIKDYRIIHALFSKSGFTEEVMNLIGDDLLLFDKGILLNSKRNM